MIVRVDEAGHHDFARGINSLSIEAAELSFRCNARDESVFDEHRVVAQHVRFSSRGENRSVFDEKWARHGSGFG
jgi:hypothetical protein